MEALRDVQGSEQLTSVFGYWPSFHDAEVLRFSLDRSGHEEAQGPTVECVVHVFEMTSDVSAEGYYILRKHSLVTFRFLEAAELRLDGFNQQNVLWGLEIVNIAERQLERIKFAVSFPASFGMEAEFKCFAVEIMSVKPCDSEGNLAEDVSISDGHAWDAQIEADAQAGKLDALAEEALAEYRAGKTREI